MDFSKYRTRYVALEVLYLGHDYSGLARQASTSATIEGHLFSALERTRLIPEAWTWEGLRYSRAGRTDRGVSALRQVLALDLRSAARADQDPKPQAEEIDYPRVLNRTLPSDIRVTAWADAPEDFSARFSAAHREYTYIFLSREDEGEGEEGEGAGSESAASRAPAAGLPSSRLSVPSWPAFYDSSSPSSVARDALLPPRLDVARMRDAASRLLGTHDFRNFCKVDVSAARHFVRTMLDVDLERLPGRAADGTVAVALRVRGTAFLWHQIRCMAAVLRAVGLGLEEPSIVDQLLDVNAHPRKPMYAPDDDRPLLLYECAYAPNTLAWRRTLANASEVQRALREHMDDSLLRATIVAQMAKGLAGDPTVEDAQEGRGEDEETHARCAPAQMQQRSIENSADGCEANSPGRDAMKADSPEHDCQKAESPENDIPKAASQSPKAHSAPGRLSAPLHDAPMAEADEVDGVDGAGVQTGDRKDPTDAPDANASLPTPSIHALRTSAAPTRARGLPWIEDPAAKRYKPLMQRPKEPAIQDRAGAADGICIEAAELARKKEEQNGQAEQAEMENEAQRRS